MTENKPLTMRREGDVAVVVFDTPGEKVNTLSQATMEDMPGIVDEIVNDSGIKAAVIISGKKDGFIAGADIDVMRTAKSAQEVEGLSQQMHREFDKLERSDKPVVAAIHGAALGGGLEVALACDYRIATDHPKTVLGLPEVMLGLLPAGGGTQRLPELVGLQDALDMLLTGKNIRPRKGKKMGLVDKVVSPYGLEQAAIATARKLASGDLAHKEPDKDIQEKALEDTPPGRMLVFSQARKMIMKKTLGNYPAPLAILDVVEEGISKGREAGLAAEAKRFGELAMTPEAKALMSLFFANTALKKNRYGKGEKDIETVGVLGAGLMGAGIALVSTLKGHRVVMKDISTEGLARGQKQIYDVLDRRRKRKAITPFERDRLMANVVSTLGYTAFKNADLVIEAVFEDLKIKHKVIEELEAHISEDCVVASNTSALPIAKIAEGSKRPENVVGMHYFSPVNKMPLLEVITTDKTSKRAAQMAVQCGIEQGKTVIVVKDGPGFYTTRILAPYMDEAALIALEGLDLHEFDRIMKRYGFPVGPITLLDEVGIDVGAHVAQDMQPFFEPRFGERDTAALDAMVKQGFLGRKTGKGFFVYDEEKKDDGVLETVKGFVKQATGLGGGKKRPVNEGALELLKAHGVKAGKHDDTEVQERMAMRFLNEAVYCLQEEILANPTDGDIGAVFGLGWPPFTGGPFRFIDRMGAGKITQTMERLANKYGKRFEPAPLLVDHAKAGTTFHA
jgi:enoyl-CoA hydratase/long-chain 3-hydroxyacyl-CoA dehydrogenase